MPFSAERATSPSCSISSITARPAAQLVALPDAVKTASPDPTSRISLRATIALSGIPPPSDFRAAQRPPRRRHARSRTSAGPSHPDLISSMTSRMPYRSQSARNFGMKSGGGTISPPSA